MWLFLADCEKVFNFAAEIQSKGHNGESHSSYIGPAV